MTALVALAIAERAGGRVAQLTVSRPGKLNTLDAAGFEAFAAAVDSLAEDDGVRALVLAGEGERAFVGGADIGSLAALDTETAVTFITRVHRCCRALRDLPVPVIARMDGYTLGAGLEIAASCDMRVASGRAFFGMPEVRIGVPSVVEAALLPGLIGWGRARRLLLTGETIDAQTALAWGLVEEVVPPAELDAAIDRLLIGIIASGPVAVRSQKALMRRWEDVSIRDAIAAGIPALADAFRADEPKKLMRDFFERQAVRRAALGRPS